MCGIAGILSVKNRELSDIPVDLRLLDEMIRHIDSHGYSTCRNNRWSLTDKYLGGNNLIESIEQQLSELKHQDQFYQIVHNQSIRNTLIEFSNSLSKIIDRESRIMENQMGHLASVDLEIMAEHIDRLKDILWRLTKEIEDNVKKIELLSGKSMDRLSRDTVNTFRILNSTLNSIDRLEVRGRDSAGISILFIFDSDGFKQLTSQLEIAGLMDSFNQRAKKDILLNKSISIHIEPSRQNTGIAVAFTYKIAAEIGSLGDNISFLRTQISEDEIFQKAVRLPHQYLTIISHTRWASVGAITEPNCHPVDNLCLCKDRCKSTDTPIIHVCLNGDIDNYSDLKKEYEQTGHTIHPEVSTDTKIIPLQIEFYINQGMDVTESFRRALNDFKGSHAIAMHTDLAPGKLFLAQRGSGQAIFVGLAKDQYIATSEVYGFVEETSAYLKLDGEKIIRGKTGDTQGQIYVLDQSSSGGIQGITAMYYDGTPISLTEKDIKYTKITSRDIDRQGFPHYFLKEISESPSSVEKTLLNRWKIIDEEKSIYGVSLNERIIPASLKKALADNTIRRIWFVGQGTAGVAAQACAEIMNYYMNDPNIQISSMKASELSGFRLGKSEDSQSMRDSLVIAISQSGTTTDTNRTVDMVKARGAYTLGIVNRRDSDLTFKVDGVMYTSSGRDIEMSVASTKAFYGQIIAGALVGLYIARLKQRRDDKFVSDEIRRLLEIPSHMRTILSMKDQIEASARNVALTRTYWAAVGSGPNKSSADEIRIKLSELCYKTISSDFVEDKKHIDLSSEPLIIICAAGARDSVIGDIIKDTAIFRAHKAIPIVIADEGEYRFGPYAEYVFHIPRVKEHLAPILNTLTGHIWGYYAALTIHEGSRFLYNFRQEIQAAIDNHLKKGLDVYELILSAEFKETIANFYKELRKRQAEKRLPISCGLEGISDMILLLKYLSGRLPVSDFELDFGVKGTAINMLNTLFKYLGEAINQLSRPVDAIKHQAKTVTVGTSRIVEKIEGILFHALETHGIKVSQIINRNVIVLRNLQSVVSEILGSTLYKISGLNALGEPTDSTTIEVIRKEGTSKLLESRTEKDKQLKGSKRIIVTQGNVYIGKGRKDKRSVLIIPVISVSPMMPNIIEYLLLLHVAFKKNISLPEKIKALGGKYEHIKNIVQESSNIWNDTYIECVDIEDLFGLSAEKIAEAIIEHVFNP